MKYSKLIITIFGLFLFLPTLAFAATLFSPPPLDKSVEYLGLIFGKVGDLSISGGNSTVSVLMRLVNQIVLSLGFLIIGWTVFVSSIHSAQEGEVMGKKWSSIWIPTRAVTGMFLLLPSASGYSYIQITVMWFILQSIGAADALWNQVLLSREQSGPINQPAASVKLINGSDAIYGMLKSKICQQMLNAHKQEYELNEPISFFQKGNQAIWGTPSDGVEICGKIDLTPFINSVQSKSSSPLSPEQQAQAAQNYFNALDLVQLNLETTAFEAVNNPPDTWSGFFSLTSGVIELKTSISSFIENALLNANPPPTDTDLSSDKGGWIHAGGYYFHLVRGNSSSRISSITFSAPTVSMDQLCIEKSAFCPTLKTDINTTFGHYVDYVSNNLSTQKVDSSLSNLFPGMLDNKNSVLAPLNKVYKRIVIEFVNDLSGNNQEDNNDPINIVKKEATRLAGNTLGITLTQGEVQNTDPLVALMTVGQKIMSGSETAIWVCLSVLVALALFSSVMKSVSSAGFIVEAIVNTAITILLFVSFLLWAAGMSIGLYLPLIPYLLFIFGGLAWIILVIEAMVASPLIALSLIVPSEDEIGKATNALLILVGLFFRPALMIVGFIFSAKLLMVSVAMLNYGFVNILNNTILGIGLFGAVAIIIMYAGILTAVAHEAFSLIYVLPEKALRWMGVTGEGQDILSNLKKIEGSVDKGAQTSLGIAKGATSAAMKLGK